MYTCIQHPSQTNGRTNNPPDRVGAQSGLGPGPGWGPYGPMWALMGPPGQVLEKASTFRQLSVETFGPISHASGPKLAF